MKDFERFLNGSNLWLSEISIEQTLLSLVLAFVLGQAIAWAYTRTHTGVSYSRSFTQSLVLITMIVSLVMHTIGNNIITAFGLLGALAIIRFRNVLKDTRDTAFVFMALVIGLAVGSQKQQVAVLGTVFLILVVFYFRVTGFGSRGYFDGHITCLHESGEEAFAEVKKVLWRFCRTAKRISHRPGGSEGLSESIFEIRLRDRNRSDELLDTLRGLGRVDDAVVVLRDELMEV